MSTLTPTLIPSTAEPSFPARISPASFQALWQSRVPQVVARHEAERRRVREALGLPLPAPEVILEAPDA